MNPIVRAVHNFTRRGERDLVAAIDAQADAAADAVRVAAALARGELGHDEAVAAIDADEQAGDDARARLVRGLSTTLATPIDREDLFRLSRSVDDVVDNLRDFVHEYAIYGQGPEPLVVSVLDAVADAVTALDEVAAALVESPERLEEAARGIRRNDVRDAYQRAMGELLVGDVTARMLTTRELLRRLDVVGLRLAEAADALADGAVKRRS